MTEPLEQKEATHGTPFRCQNCGGPYFDITSNGQLVCASANMFIFYERRQDGCGWRGALHEPQMEIVKCL